MHLSKAAAKRILKEVGAQRVSDAAALELAEIVNRYAYSLAKKSVSLAAHARRSTVQKKDIDLAK